MFRTIALFLIFIEELVAAPFWVESLRSGEERFKLQNGTTTFFRQLGQTCESAINLVEKDLVREFDMLVKYTTEVVYEDELGCAVTVSVGAKPEPRELEVNKALLEKAKTAQKHAIYGLTRDEFIRFTKDKSPIITNSDPYSYCLRATNTTQISVHGLVQICWKDNVIQGYCVPKADACWKKNS